VGKQDWRVSLEEARRLGAEDGAGGLKPDAGPEDQRKQLRQWSREEWRAYFKARIEAEPPGFDFEAAAARPLPRVSFRARSPMRLALFAMLLWDPEVGATCARRGRCRTRRSS
jgi:hypothetical protein